MFKSNVDQHAWHCTQTCQKKLAGMGIYADQWLQLQHFNSQVLAHTFLCMGDTPDSQSMQSLGSPKLIFLGFCIRITLRNLRQG